MDIALVREAVWRAISPIKPTTAATEASKDFLFSAKRSKAGSHLPEYYLVYFLFVDLLGFKDLGQFEKVAWSVPIDFHGRGFLIEHRKFGLGLFISDDPNDENAATEIVGLIQRGVKEAEPYFTWKAQEAVKDSKLNVVNNARELYERYHFLASRYNELRLEAERRSGERITTQLSETSWTTSFPSFELSRQAKWLALSTIESFFSWTEHVFILLAILQGECLTGDSVAKLAMANWNTKFKTALSVTDPETKQFYEKLLLIRRQLRNFVAHGAFGKDGEAFKFHSGCGAVPVRLPYLESAESFRFGRGIEFVDHEAIELLQRFEAHLWSGSRSPAKLYIQEHGMPLILTMAQNGEYQRAMASDDSMAELSDYLASEMDRHANMDF